jgi:formiminotetrahydrofolate cyclodeaminase
MLQIMSTADFATPLAASYTDRLAAATPTPGGGSASAVTASIAASLLQMVASISLEKATDEQKPELEAGVRFAGSFRARLLDLGAEDERAYAGFLEALRLPRLTPEDRELRKQAIELATIHATSVPMEIVEMSLTLLHQIPNIARVANKNLISDLATAAHLAYGAANGTLVMVNVNLDAIKTPETKTELTAKYDRLGIHLQLALSEALVLVGASTESDIPF